MSTKKFIVLMAILLAVAIGSAIMIYEENTAATTNSHGLSIMRGEIRDWPEEIASSTNTLAEIVSSTISLTTSTTSTISSATTTFDATSTTSTIK